MAESPPLLYLIAPASLASWFNAFADLAHQDRVLSLSDGATLDDGLRRCVRDLLHAQARRGVLLSSHESLERDVQFAQELRADGCRLLAQSARCAGLGRDKFAMKDFLHEQDIATPAWRRAGDARRHPGGGPVVVKRRSSTQSVGIRLANPEDDLRADEYAEEFVEGVEYSVVVYRDEAGVATFPPVWKGSSDRALTPPWRRLRLCPTPDITPALERTLRQIAETIVVAADGAGHIEVELICAPGQQPQVLEVNPRVCGTMRISAMATGVPIFALPRLTGQRGALQATSAAAEAPYSGPAITDPDAGVFATSRITVAAADLTAARQKLDRLRALAQGHHQQPIVTGVASP